MDHAWYLSFMLRLDRKAVTVIAHGDDGILQISAAGTAYHIVQLAMDSVVCQHDIAPDGFQSRAGIVADFFLGKDAATDFRREQGQRFQRIKKCVQRIFLLIVPFTSSVGLYPADVFQHAGDFQQFRSGKGGTDAQGFYGVAQIFIAAEGSGAFFEYPG